MTLRVLTVCAVFFVAMLCLPARAEVLVAAASNIMGPLNEIAVDFENATGEQVKISYGSSGTLVRQILRGAPFEVLLSADRKHVDILAREGGAVKASEDYATGRLALFLTGRNHTGDDLSSLVASYKLGKIRKFAIANPNHAPYGRAAREVLQKLGVWEMAQPTLVMGENATQAAWFAASGSTDGGLVPLSLAIPTKSPLSGKSFVVPERLHEPLHQKMALLLRAGSAAIRFYDFMRSDRARSVFLRYGYAVPVRGG